MRQWALWLMLWLSGNAYASLASPQSAADLPSAAEPSRPDAGRIFVVRRGWHIDIGFAVKGLDVRLRPVAAHFPEASYLLFGFGDERYLLSRHHGAPTLSGALLPGRGLVLVSALKGTPADAFGAGHVLTLDVSEAQLEDIAAFVFLTLSDAASPRAAGPYEGSAFYGSPTRYSGFHTCNTWAAEALAAGRLPVRTRGVLLAHQLWRQVRRLDPERSPAP